MTLSIPAVVLLVTNLGLLWLLLAAPLGMRTIRIRRVFDATPDRIWGMVHPLGREADWSPYLLSSERSEDGHVVQRLSHVDRTGAPIRRILDVRTEEMPQRRSFLARIIEDSALDPAFWAYFREHRVVEATDGGTELIVQQTDRYRGLAFFVFRYFMLRREMSQMQAWLRTGKTFRSGTFEHPLTQVGLAVVSTLIIWPFFGLSLWGLTLSIMLTVVIALHELGHMAAYRAFGHTKARMIFIPLLGGVAIGGRPYDRLFEVAICALMGSGFSAFLVPAVVAIHVSLQASAGLGGFAGTAMVFLLVLSAFNLLNLLPMSRFDGGQVLRQVFPTNDGLMGASFLVAACFLWVGSHIGIPLEALLGGLAVMALVSLLGAGSVKPRHALEDMSNSERLNAGLAYYAVLAIHAYGVVYACDRLFP